MESGDEKRCGKCAAYVARSSTYTNDGMDGCGYTIGREWAQSKLSRFILQQVPHVIGVTA